MVHASHDSENDPAAGINAYTMLFGVIGHPVPHSLSPGMHNAALRAMRYDGVFPAFEVRDPAGALNAMRAPGIRGLSVTIAHKMAVMDSL